VQTVLFLLVQEITEIEGALLGGLDLLSAGEAADAAAAAAAARSNATAGGSAGGQGAAGEAAASAADAAAVERKPQFTLRGAEAAARNGKSGGGLLAASESLLGGASPAPPPSAALRPARAGAPELAVDIEARDAAAYTATVIAALERNLAASLRAPPAEGGGAAAAGREGP